MKTTSTESQSTARSHYRRATPLGIRLLLGVSILFGIWVDVSSIGTSTADRNQIHLLGLTNEHSTVATVVKTLASRRS